MRHLVTGGSGFLGNLLAKELLKNGETVRVIDVWDDPFRSQNIEFIHCDVRDRDKLIQAMKGIDVVHHLAALVPLNKCSLRSYYSVNVEGTRIVAEEASRANVGSFIQMSSSSVFGIPIKCPIDNNCPFKPLDSYGKSKLAGELIAKGISERTGLPLIIIRPRTVLGDGRLGIFQILFEWVRQGIDIYTIGSGNNTIQFIHADDLISACLLLSKSGHTGSFNVGTDHYGTIKSTLKALIQFAQSPSEIRSLPEQLTLNILSLLDKLQLSPLAAFHYLTYPRDSYYDISALTNLGWCPKYSNTDMFCEIYASFINKHKELMSFGGKSPHRRPVAEKLLKLVKLFH